MITRILVALALVAVLAVAVLWTLGSGVLGSDWSSGDPIDEPIPAAVLAERASAQESAASALDVRDP